MRDVEKIMIFMYNENYMTITNSCSDGKDISNEDKL